MSIYNLINEESNIEIQQFNMNRDDPSLNSEMAPAFQQNYSVDSITLNNLFLSKYGLDYISDYFLKNEKPLRILSLPKATNTCYEKADLLEDWNPLNVIKAFYLESSQDGLLYAIIVPETGCFLNRDTVKEQLNLGPNERLFRATYLPNQMKFGTCSPFVRELDLLKNGGKIKNIVFDKDSLILKKHENSLDDFSFGLDHRFSIQMNYFHCYRMLHHLFSDAVVDRDILCLSFKERLVRKKGRIKIDYEFRTLNYRTAQFINDIHGFGDVSIVNDHIDELFIPDCLTTSNKNNH